MKVPTYGKEVRVRSDAPDNYRPGESGSVFSIFESQTKAYEEATGVPIGEMAIGVEFSDGVGIEMAFTWLIVV